MPSFDSPVLSSSSGFVSVKLNDKDEMGAYVLIRFPDPKGPQISQSEDREQIVASAKEYIEAALGALT